MHETFDVSSSKIRRSTSVFPRVAPLLLCVGLIAPFSAHAEYSFQLINPPGSGYTQVFGINNAGKVVGNDAFNDDSFIYDMKKGEYTYIDDTLVDGDFSALEISNNGVIVGSVFNESGNQNLCAIRDKDGTITTFSPPTFSVNPEASSCQARGVNPDGKISGFQIDEFGEWSGFIYDPEYETFEEFLPSFQTIPQAINAQGQNVGSVFLLNDEAYDGSPAGRYGYLRQEDGSLQYFAISEGRPGQTRARGISENGLVTGWYLDQDSFEFKSFVTILSPDTEFEEISVSDIEVLFQSPCNPDETIPEGFVLLGTDMFSAQIRNDGVVVGQCNDVYQDTENPQNRLNLGYGFIATPAQ